MAIFGKGGKELIPAIAIHPGETLQEELEARSIRQIEFAKILDIRPQHLNDLLKGKRHISPEIALKLEKALDISAEFWVRLQADYELTLVRLAHKHKAA